MKYLIIGIEMGSMPAGLNAWAIVMLRPLFIAEPMVFSAPNARIYVRMAEARALVVGGEIELSMSVGVSPFDDVRRG